MSRTSPGITRKSLLRRLTAGVLGAVLCGTLIAEPLLADVCDGDAPAAAQAAVLPHRDVGSIRAADPGSVLIHAVRASNSKEVAGSDRPATPTGSRHDVHVCHCVHAHGGTLGRGSMVTASNVSSTDAVALRADRLPSGAALEPPLRPPASSHAA